MFVSFFIQIQSLYNINKIIGFMLMTIYNRMFTDKLTDVNVSAKICKDILFYKEENTDEKSD